MKSEISKHTNDIIQKYANGLFRNVSLEFYGIKAAPIKEIINVELPVVEVNIKSTDFIFLLEDNSYLHLEFQSTYDKDDILRFAIYDIRLFSRDRRDVKTVIIYSGDIEDAKVNLNTGSFCYMPDKIMMSSYDGNAIYEDLEEKIKEGKYLADIDMLNLILLPLMKHTMPREEFAVNSIKLAQTIPDTNKRNACIAATFAFASRFLDETKIKNLLEVLKMTDLATLLVEDAVEEAADGKAREIAKKAIKKGYDILTISDLTGLDESIIKELQAEINNQCV